MDAIASGKTEKDAIVKVASAPAGTETLSDETMANTEPDELKKIREKAIRDVLEGNLGPRDTRDRSHRKNDKAINGQASGSASIFARGLEYAAFPIRSLPAFYDVLTRFVSPSLLRCRLLSS